ncbi:MAG: hypothetical protein AOA65_0875 [Candidatus Bathyarchaeota archaeon BA1]|nr:MAG: hypothetical protein AOA65_0875 [Candidatus Bathyarchaeota archaeon BA1]
MSAEIRRYSPILLAFCSGMLVIADYYIEEPTLNKFASDWLVFITILVNFALIIGLVSLSRIHIRNVRRRRTGWHNSLFALIALYALLLIGWPLSEGKFTAHPTYAYWFKNLYVPLDSTIFSMLAFYIASAAYRAFRVRTREATVLLISSVLVMLGRAPIGPAIWAEFTPITSWIMSVPNTAGMRGIIIGVAIGTLSMGIRVLTGRERGYLGPGA